MVRKLFLLFLLAFTVQAQMRVRSNVTSSLYFYEGVNQTGATDFYQDVALDLASNDKDGFKLNGYFNVYRSAVTDAWRSRFYNGYLQWSSDASGLKARLGRQFFYRDVINGSLDGLSLEYRPVKFLQLTLVGGKSVSWNRESSTQDDYGLGMEMKINAVLPFNVGLTYYQKQRPSGLYRQQAGAIFNGSLFHWRYLLQYRHDLLSGNYQRIRLMLFYAFRQSNLTLEASSQKPEIYEDLFRQLFELEAFNQLRVGYRFFLNDYSFNLRVAATLFSEGRSSARINFSVNRKWGGLGIVFENGYFGQRSGLTGRLNYDLTAALAVYMSSSYYNYERRLISAPDEATALAAGIRYHLNEQSYADVQVQQGINRVYASELRGLLRFNYRFNQ